MLKSTQTICISFCSLRSLQINVYIVAKQYRNMSHTNKENMMKIDPKTTMRKGKCSYHKATAPSIITTAPLCSKTHTICVVCRTNDGTDFK